MRVDKCNAKLMKAIRTALGLTQTQIGDILNRRQEQISRWENGVTNPGLDLKQIIELDKKLMEAGLRFADFEEND